ncbi:MAG: hypothetical protein ACREUW_05725 [Burkholderiales bacterium]
MIFTLATDDGSLLAFSSAPDAIAYCEGIDVKHGIWLFFSDDGSPLDARFERPTPKGQPVIGGGVYVLQRAMSGLWLQERLSQVKSVEGCGLSRLSEVIELLKVNRAKRALRGA